MRSPEHRLAQPRAGRHFEDDLQLRYLSPGAFTVLPPDNEPPPDPPAAPEPYRLSSTRKHKNKAFAIIGEVDANRSRSPSPSGRVSPFRGRGFNPVGSRIVSPIPSHLPPEDARLTPTNLSPRHVSKIPQLKRKGSCLAFGEKVHHKETSPTRRKLTSKLSQSLTNLEGNRTSTRPPPSPRKNVNKTPAFQRLSPIVGSSPEPSQSLSSPSRIPKSRSTPPSRKGSPTRTSLSSANKPPVSKRSSRAVSRSQSRSESRNASREASPTKNPTSPARSAVNKYKNVQAKVNTFNKPKPKVPPKPQVLSEQSEESDIPKDNKKKPSLNRKESVNKLRTNSSTNLLSKTENGNNNNNYNSTSDSSSGVPKINNKNTVNKNNSNNNANKLSNNNNTVRSDAGDTTEEERRFSIDPRVAKQKTTSNSFGHTTKNNGDIFKGTPLHLKNTSNKFTTDTDIVTTDTDVSVYDKETTDTSTDTQRIRDINNYNQRIRDNVVDKVMESSTDKQHSNKNQGIKSNSIENQQTKNAESPVKLADILPSTTTVVSSTTTTVTQPLKIEANINAPKQYENSKPISPMVDGRVLSATSVSNAMNKMNNTVLDSQTLIKDHGFSRLSPAANAVMSVSNEPSRSKNPAANAVMSVSNEPSKSKNPAANAVISVSNEPSRSKNPALDTKNATTALPKVEPLPISSKSDSKESVNTITSNHHNSIDKINNHTNHVTHAGVISAKALEMEVQKNMSKLISPDHIVGNSVQKSINDRIKEARTVVASDVKPIRITVKEKPSDVEVQSGNIRPPVGVSNGLNERPGLPPSQQTPPNEPAKEEPPPKNACTRFFSNCKSKIPSGTCCKKQQETQNIEEQPEETNPGCFSCLKKKETPPVRINIEDETGKKMKVWDKLKCCNKHRVRDASCFPIGKRKESWAERRDSSLNGQQLSETGSKCSKDCCKGFFRKMFCVNLCCKKKIEEDPISRKASILSKKKSLTPTSVPPPEDTGPKIDQSLVEHASVMKAAIPVLPVCLAWFCLVMNCILPGSGTVFSGFFCLCIGKPRFSQKDGPKQRIGSFIINIIIGIGQLFTVLFCLVGWGWSIWWGVIMIKIAKKHKKLRHLEKIEEASARAAPAVNENHHTRDPERN